MLNILEIETFGFTNKHIGIANPVPLDLHLKNERPKLGLNTNIPLYDLILELPLTAK